jgi:hypothetical protein
MASSTVVQTASPLVPPQARSNLTVNTGATAVAPANRVLSISGNYTNNGIFTAGNSGTTTFNGTSAQTATGTMTGNSAFGNTSFTGGGVKTFITNASTSNFMVDTGATVVAPAELSVSGNYTNNGTTTHQGARWTARSAAGNDDSWESVTYGNGLFVAVGRGNDYVMTSSDGITWTARSAAGNNDAWYSVTYGNGIFVAVGDATGGGDSAMISSNGITWATTTAAGDNDSWKSVTYGNGLFVAVGIGPNRAMHSSDGITWVTATAVGDDDNWWGVTYGNGLFVAVGPVGDRIMTSPDGITWATTTVTGNDLRSVTYGNGLFVAVSNSGDRVMYSSDGIAWNSHSAAGNNDSWWGVTYANGLFVAVGSGPDVVMTSPDGISWTARSAAGNDDGWESVTYGNGLFVAVSYVNDRVMTSHLSTTTFNGTLPQTVGGTLSGASTFGNVAFINGTTTTFTNNASTSNFTVNTGATVVAPASLTISGDYRNNGTTTHTGTVTLSGTTVQTLSGTLTGTSAFNDLILGNQSTNGSSTEKAVIFQSVASTTGTFTMLPAPQYNSLQMQRVPSRTSSLQEHRQHQERSTQRSALPQVVPRQPSVSRAHNPSPTQTYKIATPVQLPSPQMTEPASTQETTPVGHLPSWEAHSHQQQIKSSGTGQHPHQ